MATQIGHQSTHSFAADRRWPRFRLDVPVRIVTHRDSKTLIVNGRGNEVSEGGMAIFVGIEAKLGERLWVEFTPPYSSEPLRVPAMVRNRSGYRYGVEFDPENLEEVEKIARLRELLRFASGGRTI